MSDKKQIESEKVRTVFTAKRYKLTPGSSDWLREHKCRHENIKKKPFKCTHSFRKKGMILAEIHQTPLTQIYRLKVFQAKVTIQSEKFQVGNLNSELAKSKEHLGANLGE